MAKLDKPVSEQEFLDKLTDEMVQRWGYPNVAMYLVQRQLGKLAGKWRRTKDDAVVKEYHNLFYELVELGWDPNLLDIEDALPHELMPELSPNSYRRTKNSKVKKGRQTPTKSRQSTPKPTQNVRKQSQAGIKPRPTDTSYRRTRKGKR